MQKYLNCEFCKELNDNSNDATFSKIYSGLIDSRIIFETDNFRVIPTLGQLFENSLLIISKAHVETMAELSEKYLTELEDLYSRIRNKLSVFGNIVGFEHGAYSENRGGCGIYHAHLHIVPLPHAINLFDFFKSEYSKYHNLSRALINAKDLQEYLLIINEDLSTGLADISCHMDKYESQFFRRELHRHFNLSGSWNWKDYITPESMLIKTVNNLDLKKATI
jgi:diadenosine tetraphosphate (Ap4A) HIT family hydrolase